MRKSEDAKPICRYLGGKGSLCDGLTKHTQVRQDMSLYTGGMADASTVSEVEDILRTSGF